MTNSPDFRKVKSTHQLISEQRRPRKMPETGWYQVLASASAGYEGFGPGGLFNGETKFLNSWTGSTGTSGHAPASWYLSENGEVRLRGKINSGAAGTVAFVLPEEVRPEFAETFICAVDGGGKANLVVFPSGEVFVESITS